MVASGESSSSRIPPGTRLNGIYVVERQIAVGGMGEVYAGRAAETGVPVAIKMIRPELAADPNIIGLFRREALALHQLRHEAIVAYYVFSIDPELNAAYLAMEFVPGRSLSDMAREGPLGFEFVRILQKRVAAGLHAAHSLGVIHRDVSSDNIILPDGDPARAKIIDFGIAKNTTDKSTIIGDGFAGKNSYISPEQLGMFGGKVTAKSDVYSLGLVLVEALLGRKLDMGGNLAEVVTKREAVPDLTGVDRRMQPLIRQMLDPNPDNRPTMDDVATREVTGMSPPSPATRDPTIIKQPVRPATMEPLPEIARPNRLPLIAGGAAGAIALAAVAGFLLWPSGETGPATDRPPPVLTTDQARQDQARQEQERQEQARQDQARQEQARQEQVRQDQARQEQARQDQARQEQARQEQARQDQARQDQARREQAARDEQARQDQARREQAARDEQARQDQARREQAARDEQARQDQARREQAARDEQARQDQARREQAARDEQTRQQAETDRLRQTLAEQQRQARERAEQAERDAAARQTGSASGSQQTASRTDVGGVAPPRPGLRDCSQCPDLVAVPEGAMQMGSNRDPSERPIRQVTVKPFVMSRYPVTVGEWKECVRAGVCADIAKGDDRNPVNNVSYDDAQKYLAWLSQAAGRIYRLPSEAEWEYAARGGATTRFWWGDEFSQDHASCRKCGAPRQEPLPVGGFKPNAFGLFDMTGNVGQWVSDCWHRDYRGAPKDAAPWTTGMSGGRCREQVVRGGSWSSEPADQTVTSRSFYDPGVRHPSYGLRVVRNP